MTGGVVVLRADEWRAALASEEATARYIERVIEQLDEAAGTQGYCGPRMPWHEWLKDRRG
ncbi:MAG: hypothetical protein PGN16_08565 [Sphingomonas phyllosphaerae]|uniref:hypothetical protein n=1 Tax=Sphingomonas phyllosphaerae TaxID=257003 RepID=UPI002FFC31AF